jgi:hypothetical protein
MEQSPITQASAMKTFTQFVTEHVQGGLYSFRKLNAVSAKLLYEWMLDNAIPNPTMQGELHCTVVYSETDIPGYCPDPTSIMLNPATYSVQILNTALVVRFKCDTLEAQWQRAMNMGGRSKYPTFIPHITLSYQVPEDYDLAELKPPPSFLVLAEEEYRPLVNAWSTLNNLREMTRPGASEPNSIYVPPYSLDIPRNEMPQIKDANKLDFVDWLESQGIVVNFVSVPVSMLRSVQTHINIKKVIHLRNRFPYQAMNNPLVISKDDHILDGHHRWLALLNLNPHATLNAYRVNVSIHDLLDLCSQFKNTVLQQTA